ncbi:MAG: hypothetical protein AB1705_25350 [Verrucomicrobiota bacterium]
MKINLAIALGCALAVQLQAQDYEIRMSWPVKVGQRFRQITTAQESKEVTLTASGQIVRESRDSFNVRFESTLTIDEADARGKSTRQTHKVVRLEKVKDGRAENLLPKGAVVSASVVGGKTAFQIDGQPTTGEAQRALGLVIALKAGEFNDDDMFGTKERKKVGESWPIDTRQLTQEFFARTKDYEVGDMSGTMTLKGLVKLDSRDSLHITGKVTSDMVGRLPSGLKLEQGSMTWRLDGKFPLNATLPDAEQSQDMNISFSARGVSQPGAPEVQMKAEFTKDVTVKVVPLP